MDLIKSLYKKFFKINIISSIKGRVRIHIPYINNVCKEWNISKEEIGKIITSIEGVNYAEFNPITENILILYNHNVIQENELISMIKRIIDQVVINRQELIRVREQDFDKVIRKIKETMLS